MEMHAPAFVAVPPAAPRIRRRLRHASSFTRAPCDPPCFSFSSLPVRRATVNVTTPVPSRRRVTCSGGDDNERTSTSTSNQNKTNNSNSNNNSNNNNSNSGSDTSLAATELAEVTEQLAELDTIAEAWIGSDIGRWEWYERFRGRRTKMLRQAAANTARLDDDVHQVLASLMELDATLGTKLLADDGAVSPTGWTFLFAVALIYVSVAYAVVHAAVFALYALSHPVNFP